MLWLLDPRTQEIIPDDMLKRLLKEYGLPESGKKEKNLNRFMSHIGMFMLNMVSHPILTDFGHRDPIPIDTYSLVIEQRDASIRTRSRIVHAAFPYPS